MLNREGRAIIHTLKYKSGRWLLPDLVKIGHLLPGYMDFLKDSVLVPVPLHRKRERQRGYNQSLLLAEAFASSLPEQTEVRPLLKRVINTRTQTRLSREKRRQNMKGAFVVKKKYPLESQKRHILIDDVFTTGSTLNSCAKTLKDAGVEKIDILTLAHG